MKIIGWVAVILVVALIVDACREKDSTDPVNGRSGMGLRVDAMTGCHYLTTVQILGESSITPRLRADGSHVCTGKDER